MSKTKSQLAKQYQKKTDKQHILDAPDTYIGSVEEDNVVNWDLVITYHLRFLFKSWTF